MNEHEHEGDNWHINKTVNLGTILSIVILFAGQIYTLGVLLTSFKADIEALNVKIDVSTRDRIHGSTVLQMFENRDLQINDVRLQMSEMKEWSIRFDAKLDKIYESVNAKQ